jgi:hypothetical protein
MEVLTAYVRQHAPLRPEEEAQQVEEDAAAEKKSEEDSSGKSETVEVTAPAADIQAIMTVIGRRTRSFGHGESEGLDLHETNLRGANLWGADLSGAYLSVLYVEGPCRWQANLREAFLRGAHLSGETLTITGANLSEAKNLTQEQLEQAVGDENTQLPSHLKAPKDWNVKTDE